MSVGCRDPVGTSDGILTAPTGALLSWITVREIYTCIISIGQTQMSTPKISKNKTRHKCQACHTYVCNVHIKWYLQSPYNRPRSSPQHHATNLTKTAKSLPEVSDKKKFVQEVVGKDEHVMKPENAGNRLKKMLALKKYMKIVLLWNM